jgi:hypothetical protein
MKSGWEVEWCSELPLTPEGETDHDSATFRIKDFADHEAAIRFAKQILSKDQYGSVRVTRFHQEPYRDGYPGSFREYDGESEHID